MERLQSKDIKIDLGGRSLDTLFERRNGRLYLAVDQEMFENVLQQMSRENEKRKAIEKLSSSQRKRHQHQFAAVHFLLYGIEEFIKGIAIDPRQKRDIMIVYDYRTSRAAKLLKKQIEEMKRMGITCDAALYTADEFKKIYRGGQKPEKTYSIFFGDFLESKEAGASIQDWRFHEFGFRYGWRGNTAVISFDREPYVFEYSQMVDIAKAEFVKINDQMDLLKRQGYTWSELSTTNKVLLIAGAAAVAAVFGAAVLAIADNNERKRMADKSKKEKENAPDPQHLPDAQVNKITLSEEQLEELKTKTRLEALTDEETEYVLGEFEYGEEWLQRDDELLNMSLEEYEYIRCVEDYGPDDEDMYCGDED